MQKYSTQVTASLPPGCQKNPQQSTLHLAHSYTTLVQPPTRSTTISYKIWGLQQTHSLNQQKQNIYSIRTSHNKFLQYLQDMKVMVIKVCDSRNGEEIGTGLLNWMLYTCKTDEHTKPNKRTQKQKSIQPKKENKGKNGVFMDQQFLVVVPVYNYKKKLVAEVGIQVKWMPTIKKQRVIQQQQNNQIEKWLQNENSNSHKANVLTTSKVPQPEAYHPSASSNQKQFKSAVNIPPSSLLPSSIPNPVPYSKKLVGLPLVPKAEDQLLAPRPTYPQHKYELEKAQLKLQAEQFLTLTQPYKNIQNNSNKKDNMITLRLSELVFSKGTPAVEFIDVWVRSDTKDQDKLKGKDKDTDKEKQEKMVRVFPVAKEFSAELVAKYGQLLEVDVPKLGKGQLDVNSLKDKPITKLQIYGKTGKIGSITITKLSQQKANIPSQPTPPASLPKNPSTQLPPTSCPLYLLVRVLQSQHPQSPYALFIKSHKLPLHTPTILPLSELGSLFAIEFRNLDNETIDSVVVDQYLGNKGSGLGCLWITNGWIKGDKGRILVQIGIGELKQVNYEISRINSFNNMSRNQDRDRKYNRENSKDQNIDLYKYTSKQQRYEQRNKWQTNSRDEKKQKITNPQQLQPIDIYPSKPLVSHPSNPSRPHPLSSSSASSKLVQRKPGHRRNVRQNPKIYTEVARLPSQPYQQNADQYQQNQQQQSQTIYLTQLLCRFLHALPPHKFDDAHPNTVEEFIALLEHFLIAREEKELIYGVVDMFVDQKQAKFQYEEFVKCLKGYHSFLDLWWKMRVDYFSELTKCQPDYESRIQKYSQLNTIPHNTLWHKIFPNISNPSFQLQVDKLLHTSADQPLSSIFLMEQLKSIQNENPPREANMEIIYDLGKIIKETIQSILENCGFGVPAIADEKVNIRVMVDVLEEVGVGASYWEALMIIEELKSWYRVDQDCNQGIVSAAVVEVWLKSVLNRSKTYLNPTIMSPQLPTTHPEHPNPQQAQHPNPQSQPLKGITVSKPVAPSNPSNLFPISKPSSNPISASPSQRGQHRQVLENRSMAKSELNEEEIENIANLLRDNDNFRMGTFVSEKPNSKVYDGSVAVGKILDDDILDNSSNQPSTPSHNPTPTPPKPPLYLHCSLTFPKLKQSVILPSPFRLQCRLKSMPSIQTKSQHYFYFRQINQINGCQFVTELPQGWENKVKGLQVQIVEAQNGQSTIGESQDKGKREVKAEQEQKVLMYGMLLVEEIQAIGQEKTKNKTVVLYSGKEIIGKITLQLTLHTQPPPMPPSAPTTISLLLHPAPSLCNSPLFLTILPESSETPPLQLTAQKIQEIQVSNTFYRNCLKIVVGDLGYTVVPLEELYFRGAVAGDYPVVAETGVYLGNIAVRVQIGGAKDMQTRVKQLSQHSPSYLLQQPVPAPQSQKHLLILHSILSLTPTLHPTLSFLSSLLIRDAYTRTTLYRSPYYIEHEHKENQNYCISDISKWTTQNYYVVEVVGDKIKNLTIQLEYEGRAIGVGEQVLKIGAKQPKIGIYGIRYVGWVSDIVLAIRYSIVPVPQQFNKYNLSRIYKQLSKPATQPPNSPISSLTLTQNRLLSELVLQYPNLWSPPIPISASEQKQLLKQLLYIDANFSGLIEWEILTHLFLQIVGEDKWSMFLRVWNEGKVGKEGVSYVEVLGYFRVGEAEEGQFGFRTQLGLSAMENIDRLHSEIKNKYKNN